MALPDPEPDERLAARAAAGAREAFEQLIERHASSVVNVLERRLGDHHRAMDMAQEVWVRVFRTLPRFRAELSFRSWLFAIVLNAARDEGRRRQRSPLVFVDDARDLGAASPDPVDRLTERSAVEGALATIAEPFRTALVLVDLEGLTYEEAARSLECAVGTVKSRVNRGRLAFRDAWTRTWAPAGGGAPAAEGAMFGESR